MKYYSIDFKRNKELQLKDTEIPKPKANEVLIRMRAWSLNYRDLMVKENAYGLSPDNLIPLSDGAGEIVEVGSNSDNFKVGDKVCPIFMQSWLSGQLTKKYSESALGGSINGVLSEYICLPEESVVKFPEHLSFEEAACLPCAAVTAYNALAYSNSSKDNDLVLILGTGGVSTFALQFAKALGLRTIITSKSDSKLEIAKKLGADITINYQNFPDWDTEVLKVSSSGVGNIIEVGGAGTLNKSIEVCRYGGTISLIGVLTGIKAEINTASILRKNLKVQGIFVGSRDCFEQMNKLIEKNKIHPIIDKVFKFNEVALAYDYLKAANHHGKVVISAPVDKF